MEDEKPFESETARKGVYNGRKICAGSYIGGPLAAGYMIAENFKAIGESSKVVNTWVVTITITVLLLVMPFLFNLDRVPGLVIPVTYTSFAFFYFRFYQEEKINAYVRANGKFFGWGRTIVVGIIGLLILLSTLLPIAFLEGDFSSSETIKTYGVLKHEIVFDKENISEQEVDKIADALTKTAYFDHETQKFTVAKKLGDRYEITIGCNELIKTDPEAIINFNDLRTRVQILLPDNKIIFNLAVERPDNVIKRLE